MNIIYYFSGTEQKPCPQIKHLLTNYYVRDKNGFRPGDAKTYQNWLKTDIEGLYPGNIGYVLLIFKISAQLPSDKCLQCYHEITVITVTFNAAI